MLPHIFRLYSRRPPSISFGPAAPTRAASWWSMEAPGLLKAVPAFTLPTTYLCVEPSEETELVFKLYILQSHQSPT